MCFSNKTNQTLISVRPKTYIHLHKKKQKFKLQFSEATENYYKFSAIWKKTQISEIFFEIIFG